MMTDDMASRIQQYQAKRLKLLEHELNTLMNAVDAQQDIGDGHREYGSELDELTWLTDSRALSDQAVQRILSTLSGRAARAWRSVQHWIEAGEGIDVGIRDMLADVMHLCDATDVDFNEQVRIASMHHEAEKGGEA